MENRFITMIFVLAAFVMGYVIVVLLPNQLDRESRAKDIAIESGCSYIGHARDLNTVFFFDCNGTVVMRRIK